MMRVVGRSRLLSALAVMQIAACVLARNGDAQTPGVSEDTGSLPRAAELGPARWPQFRGPTGQGLVEAEGLPVRWSETENVVWKTPISGVGHSSPVVWDEQIWVTTGSRDGKVLGAICVDRESGEIVHSVTVLKPTRVLEIHHNNTYASPTPCIEEGRLYVHYGRYGTACVDTQSGEVLWRNTDLVIEHQGGPGSSPVLFGDLLIVNCDGADDQYVVALDKTTGAIAWKRERSAPFRDNPIYHRAFSTPLLIEHDGHVQLISPGADQVHAYDPGTAEELWHVRYAGFSTVPAPAAADGRVYVCTGFFNPQLLAIQLGGEGDVTRTHVSWRSKGAVPDTPSPIVVDGRVYLVSDKGVATCLDGESGERMWVARLGGKYSASPISDGRHLYCCGEQGQTKVLAVGDKREIVATNRLSGRIMASPAVSGNSLILRTDSALYRVAEEGGVGRNPGRPDQSSDSDE